METKEIAKLIIKDSLNQVDTLCAHVQMNDNQKTFPGNTSMKGLLEWYAAGNVNFLLNDWAPISEMKIKNISENVLTLDL